MSKERYPIEWTEELMAKLRKYSKISASELMGNEGGSRAALFIAEEALSSLCIRWLDNPPTAKTRTDGFYFISMKHAVINEINKHLNTQKRRMYNDLYTIQLDEPYEGMRLELLDESTIEGYREALLESDNYIERQLGIIVEALEESEYIEDIDYEIFRLRYIEGYTLVDIAKELGYSRSHIYVRHKRVKNVINHLAKKNGF